MHRSTPADKTEGTAGASTRSPLHSSPVRSHSAIHENDMQKVLQKMAKKLTRRMGHPPNVTVIA